MEHLFTSEEKIKWFGYGEWVEEPDEIVFMHAGYKCLVVRKIMPEADGTNFGGYFCGYVSIPKDHPWHRKSFDEIKCDCHGGITYAGTGKSEEFWIGFDCGHSRDLIPSMEHNRKTIPELIKIQQESAELMKSLPDSVHHLFTPTYKNCKYAIEECKSIAEQANVYLMSIGS